MVSKAEQHCIELMKLKRIRLSSQEEVEVYHPLWKRWITKKQVINPTTGRARYKFCNGSSHIPAARLHFMLKTGKPIPKGYFIDHIDGNKNNDKPSNLQLMTHSDSHKQGTALINESILNRLCRWFQFVGNYGREPITENEHLWVNTGF